MLSDVGRPQVGGVLVDWRAECVDDPAALFATQIIRGVDDPGIGYLRRSENHGVDVFHTTVVCGQGNEGISKEGAGDPSRVGHRTARRGE